MTRQHTAYASYRFCCRGYTLFSRLREGFSDDRALALGGKGHIEDVGHGGGDVDEAKMCAHHVVPTNAWPLHDEGDADGAQSKTCGGNG